MRYLLLVIACLLVGCGTSEEEKWRREIHEALTEGLRNEGQLTSEQEKERQQELLEWSKEVSREIREQNAEHAAKLEEERLELDRQIEADDRERAKREGGSPQTSPKRKKFARWQ